MQLLNLLKESLSKFEFMELFSELKIEELTNDNIIILGTSDQVKKEWLETKYSTLLKLKLKEITGIDYDLSFTITNENQVIKKKGKLSDVA